MKDKLVAALRSGKYQQGQGRLCKDGKYCCIGVLCEIMEIPKKQLGDLTLYAGAGVSMPDDYLKQSGLYSQFGSSGGNGSDLAALNDKGYAFEQIADIIESGDYFRVQGTGENPPEATVL